MSHPYSNLPKERFWRSGVSEREVLTLRKLYLKRFDISKTDKVATAGSCFAQHLARHMRKKGFTILDVEPPIASMSERTAQKYGFLTYSARYGNIYTSRQLLQLVRDAFSLDKDIPSIRDEDFFEKEGRFFDGLRPGIEPYGLPSLDDVREMRIRHLTQVRRMFRRADVFVFTFGLTETFENRKSGTVYPMCPGVVAGEYSDDTYSFLNLTFSDCYSDFSSVLQHLRRINPKLKVLITVSPVPLTATASEDHVLTATTYSKSVLRAVCGEIEKNHDNVAYFPSYEIITSSLSRGSFFEENLRSVTEEGVKAVMHHFFSQHKQAPDEEKKAARQERRKAARKDDLVCEEQLLGAFGQSTKDEGGASV